LSSVRLRTVAILALGLPVAFAGCGGARPSAVWPGSAATHPGNGPGHLAVAANTSLLALNVLIAEGDGRLVSVSPQGQVVWRERQRDPSQVFVTRTGRTLLIAEAQRSVMVMRRVDSGAVSYVYGTAAKPGALADRLRDPQTALETDSGAIAIADLGNCRILLVTPSSDRALLTLGETGVCVHNTSSSPITFAHPDAVFPTVGGALVVTEREPDWVDVLSATGRPRSAIRLHGISEPSDANAYGADRIVLAERTDPGAVFELSARSGAVIWSYGPRSGPGEPARPTIARVLGNGDVLISDTGNDRVIIVDRQTKGIVWQYGHTHVPGTTPGYLDAPTSATLVPLGGS
jgi:hypothetical protein